MSMIYNYKEIYDLDSLCWNEVQRLKSLWAPWRIEYILSEKPKECLFCRVLKEDKDEDNLLLYRGRRSFIMLNKYPYNNGHLMVVPNRHVPSIENLADDELLELNKLVQLSIKILRGAMHPHGFNIGSNIGRVAGAGIEDHFHIHIVPRWLGDTNFMPIISDTKVMVEALKETYRKLRRELKRCI